jgi:hypothetical protein
VTENTVIKATIEQYSDPYEAREWAPGLMGFVVSQGSWTAREATDDDEATP